jgi:hypothetical protein
MTAAGGVFTLPAFAHRSRIRAGIGGSVKGKR